MSFASAIEAATKSAVCGWLANGGNAAAATWIVKGSKTPMTAVAGAAAGLGLLAVNYACNYDPGTVIGQPSDISNGQCPEADWWLIKQEGPPTYGQWTVVQPLAGWSFNGWRDDGIPEWRNKQTGDLFQASDYRKTRGAVVAYGHLPNGVPTPCADPPDVTPAPYEPYTYVDQTTNCTYVVEHEAFVIDDFGAVTPVLKISAGAQARASGGVIGGCNFNPVIYLPPTGGPGPGGDGGPGGGGGDIIGGGPGGIFPWTPGPDGPNGEPWWWDIAKSVAGQLIGAGLNRLIDKLLEEKAPSVTYRLVSVCETDAQGEPISQSREVTIPQLPVLDGLVARIDAMDDLMQGLKDFKQPTCGGPRPQGQLVTARFRSVAPSPNSSRALRKELRYRDNADRPEADHIAHWLPFEWQSGPAIVTSKGAAWGIVEVWAADPAEGRRVIKHAAAIAGVDLTVAEHRWVDSAARGSRYGQPGLMKVEHDREGDPCISKRIGPSGTPGWMRDP